MQVQVHVRTGKRSGSLLSRNGGLIATIDDSVVKPEDQIVPMVARYYNVTRERIKLITQEGSIHTYQILDSN